MGKEFAIYIASYMQYSYTATFTALNKVYTKMVKLFLIFVTVILMPSS